LGQKSFQFENLLSKTMRESFQSELVCKQTLWQVHFSLNDFVMKGDIEHDSKRGNNYPLVGSFFEGILSWVLNKNEDQKEVLYLLKNKEIWMNIFLFERKMKIRMATRDIKTRKNIISGFRTSFLKKILQNQKLFDQFFYFMKTCLKSQRNFPKKFTKFSRERKRSIWPDQLLWWGKKETQFDKGNLEDNFFWKTNSISTENIHKKKNHLWKFSCHNFHVIGLWKQDFHHFGIVWILLWIERKIKQKLFERNLLEIILNSLEN